MALARQAVAPGPVVGTVKALSWKLLYGEHRPAMGPAAWDQLVREAGGPPDIKGLSLLEDVPIEPFNRALGLLDAELGAGDGAFVREAGRRTVERWAAMYRALLSELGGRPTAMVELFCRTVHPWLLNGSGSARVLLSDATSSVVELADALDPRFREGLLAGFVQATGAQADVVVEGGGRYRVQWPALTHPRPRIAAVLARAARVRLLTVTLVPVALGTALAAWQGAFEPVRAALALLSASLLHMAANAFNDVVDHRRGVDEANLAPTPFSGGSRVIQRGLLGWRGMAAWAATLAVSGVATGLALVALAGPAVLYPGLAGVALGYAYTGAPFRLSHRGLGELAALIAFGPLMVAGAAAVATGTLSAGAALAGLPVGLLMAAVLLVNELPRGPWDARTGRHTLIVRLGDKGRLAPAAALAAAFVSVPLLIVAGVLPFPTLLAVSPVPLAWHVSRRIARMEEGAGGDVRHQALTLVLHAATGLLLVAGLALEVSFR